MSYEIVYDKQFIKLPNNTFVPMVYAGSNNCYESTWRGRGRERRARSWYVFNTGSNGIFATKDEMLKYSDDYRQEIIDRNTETIERNNKDGRSEWNDTYSDDRFGYFIGISINGTTHNTTYGNFRGIFKTGCEKALTIEELIKEGIHVYIYTYVYKEETYKELGLKPLREYPKTGEEFIEMYNKAKETYEDTPISVYVSLDGATERTMKWLRKRHFPKGNKKEKQLVEVDKFYTLVARNGSYFVKKTKWGYKYTYYPYLKFANEKDAERRAKRSGAVVKLINEKTEIYV